MSSSFSRAARPPRACRRAGNDAPDVASTGRPELQAAGRASGVALRVGHRHRLVVPADGCRPAPGPSRSWPRARSRSPRRRTVGPCSAVHTRPCRAGSRRPARCGARRFNTSGASGKRVARRRDRRSRGRRAAPCRQRPRSCGNCRARCPRCRRAACRRLPTVGPTPRVPPRRVDRQPAHQRVLDPGGRPAVGDSCHVTSRMSTGCPRACVWQCGERRLVAKSGCRDHAHQPALAARVDVGEIGVAPA
jgi:hypothetical protein